MLFKIIKRAKTHFGWGKRRTKDKYFTFNILSGMHRKLNSRAKKALYTHFFIHRS